MATSPKTIPQFASHFEGEREAMLRDANFRLTESEVRGFQYGLACPKETDSLEPSMSGDIEQERKHHYRNQRHHGVKQGGTIPRRPPFLPGR